MLTPGETGRPVQLREIGDGQRSLFHIAMTLSTIEIEAMIRSKHAEGFIDDRLALPALTLLALEEPENNLAPFFLSRIVNEVLRVDLLILRIFKRSSPATQRVSLAACHPMTCVTSGSTMPARTSVVRAITLPDGPEQESKFVREAVRSYPELYFARFVILAEGASEEVVIPRIAEALNLHIDRSFVAIVPLGGRHVNHFWRLLDGLRIPHATLLDLDAGRAGGGWGRIKNTCAQLLQEGGECPRPVRGRS